MPRARLRLRRDDLPQERGQLDVAELQALLARFANDPTPRITPGAFGR